MYYYEVAYTLSSWSPEILLPATNTSVLTLRVPSELLYVVTPTQPAWAGLYFFCKALAEEESIEARAEKNIITRAKNNNEVIADDGKVKLHGGGSREPVVLGNTLKSLLDDLSQSLISFGAGLNPKNLVERGIKLSTDVGSIKGRLNTILSKKVETQ